MTFFGSGFTTPDAIKGRPNLGWSADKNVSKRRCSARKRPEGTLARFGDVGRASEHAGNTFGNHIRSEAMSLSVLTRGRKHVRSMLTSSTPRSEQRRLVVSAHGLRFRHLLPPSIKIKQFV